MADTECIEKCHYAENQAEMLKIQQEIVKSKAKTEVYRKHHIKSIDDRRQLAEDKVDLAEKFQPRNVAQSSLNYHKSNALQKDHDAIYEIGHDRGHMRTQYIEDSHKLSGCY